MLQLSCLCGQVRIAAEKRPDFIHECNCTLCRKTGARWGYFHPSQASATGATNGYSRADKEEPGADVRFCPTCGATTHFVLTASAIARHGNVQMGINMNLAEESDLTGIELRFPDGRAWSGGEFRYARKARIIGEE